LFSAQSCFSPLDKDTVYLRQEGNANSDVEAVLKMDPETHMGVRTATLHGGMYPHAAELVSRELVNTHP
jgi:hypothetical protein